MKVFTVDFSEEEIKVIVRALKGYREFMDDPYPSDEWDAANSSLAKCEGEILSGGKEQ